MRAFLVACALGFALGCVTFEYTGTICADDSQCPAGYRCMTGHCAANDGGAPSTDAGSTDAGSSCAPGCKDASGKCQPGDAKLACGQSGSCKTCGLGEQCTAGLCTRRCTNGCFDAATDACVLAIHQVAANCGTNGEACQQCAQPTHACAPGSGCILRKDCPGCTDAAGVCQAGITNPACGSPGGTCSVCGTDTSCIGGFCKLTPCSGCTLGDGGCLLQMSNLQCNTRGASCAACGQLETCSGPDSGCQLRCPGQCMDLNSETCKAGNSSSACGTTGDACTTCTSLQSCSNRAGVSSCTPNCPTGCQRSATECVDLSQQTPSECGKVGEACLSCPAMTGMVATCNQGRCLSVAVDAGVSITCNPAAAPGLPFTASTPSAAWMTYQLSAPVTAVAAADLDGDGLDEVLVLHPSHGLRLLSNSQGTLAHCAIFKPAGVNLVGPVAMTASGGTARVYAREQTSGKVYRYTWNPLTEQFPGTATPTPLCNSGAETFVVQPGSGSTTDQVWCSMATAVTLVAANGTATQHWAATGVSHLLLLPNAAAPRLLVASGPDAGMKALDPANGDAGVLVQFTEHHHALVPRLASQNVGGPVYEFLGTTEMGVQELCEVNLFGTYTRRCVPIIVTPTGNQTQTALDVGAVNGNPSSNDEAFLGFTGTKAQALSGKLSQLASPTFTVGPVLTLHDWGTTTGAPSVAVGTAAHISPAPPPRALPPADDAVLGFDSVGVNLITVH